jgi:predicted nucleic acid-binding protein
MPTELVVDASILGAAFFQEAGTARATRFLESATTLIAPELLWNEIASLSAKKVWRGEANAEAGARAIRAIPEFVVEFVGGEDLATAAFQLAVDHHLSAYDATYLALALARECVAITLDEKFVAKATAAGLGSYVTLPD